MTQRERGGVHLHFQAPSKRYLSKGMPIRDDTGSTHPYYPLSPPALLQPKQDTCLFVSPPPLPWPDLGGK